MKQRLTVLALLVVLAATGAAAAVAESGKRAGNQTVDLSGTVTGFHLAFDAKPAGRSAGDIGYETGTLADHGKRIGRFEGICTQLPHGSSQCSFTLGLPRGQILIQAAYGPGFNTGNPAQEAVIGGTRAFAGVRGQGLDRELSNTKLALHLELTR